MIDHDPTRPRPPSSPGCGCPASLARSFLRGLGAVGALAGLATTTLSTRMAFAAGPYTGDVLVVLSLRGGLDGLNTIVPTGDPRYRQARPTIAVPQNALLPLDAMFGLHPAMAPLKPWWDSGHFGAVQAVGMTNPTRSHFEAMEELERAAPGTSTRTGWLDRTLGLRDTGTAFQAVQLGQRDGGLCLPRPVSRAGHVVGRRLRAVRGLGRRRAAALGRCPDADCTRARRPPSGCPPRRRWPHWPEPPSCRTPATRRPGQLPEHRPRARAARRGAVVKAGVGLQVAAVDYGDWDMHTDMGTVQTGWLYDKLDELSRSARRVRHRPGPQARRRHPRDAHRVRSAASSRTARVASTTDTDRLCCCSVAGCRAARCTAPGRPSSRAPSSGGDLAGTTDYRQILAEILEKRCEGSEISTVFPGVSSDRLGVVRARG